MGSLSEGCELFIGEGGDDQQDRVRAMRPRLYYLVFVHDEVLAQAGQDGGRRSELKIAQAALEEGLVGENRQGCRTAGFEGACQCRWVEIGTDQAAGGR